MKQPKIHNERVDFRLYQMPCCKHLLCWVNPRPPSHCPECGTSLFKFFPFAKYAILHDARAWLKYQAVDPEPGPAARWSPETVGGSDG